VGAVILIQDVTETAKIEEISKSASPS